MRLYRFLLLSLILTLSAPAGTEAHPHAWISVRTSIILNDKDEAIAIREHWLFDKTYSAYASEDFSARNKNGALTESDLLPLAKENIHNLQEFSYFTTVENTTGKTIKLEEAKDIASAYEAVPPVAKDDPPSQQIAMDFTLALSAPLDLRAHTATYRIYDPTYYVDMAHYEQHPVAFISAKDGARIDHCHAKVELPKVDQTMLFKATSLDKNAQAPKDLGYYFSEKVTLSCSPLK